MYWSEPECKTFKFISWNASNRTKRSLLGLPVWFFWFYFGYSWVLFCREMIYWFCNACVYSTWIASREYCSRVFCFYNLVRS